MSQSSGHGTSVELVILGGFLGAGKTTAMLRLARHYAVQGLSVGIITNDQADGLVDTVAFRSHGWNTEEVAGGCFCCRFDDLLAAADRILDRHQPDILLCEPVGSCTDLVATVIRPLKKLYADRFEVAPYVALLDPYRAKEALSGDASGRKAFSAKVTYIFQMQQHEADVIAINKADLLSPVERSEIVKLVRRNFRDSEILLVSGLTGEGFDELTARLNANDVHARERVIDVDYDVYAEGEAALAWLNAEYDVQSDRPFEPDRLVRQIASGLGDALRAVGAEPAHVKMTLQSGERLSRVHLVGSSFGPELAQAAGSTVSLGRLRINARVEADPDEIGRILAGVLDSVAQFLGVQLEQRAMHAFRPSRPLPTHRLHSSAV